MNNLHLSCALAGAMALASTVTVAGDNSNAKDGWDYDMPAGQLASLCENTLAQARESFATIETDTRPATLDTVYGAYDQMSFDLQAIRHVWYMKSVHPDADYRDAAEKCMQDYTDFDDSLSLSRGFFERVAAIDLEPLTDSERYMVENQLREFRKSGVNRDQATRDRVRELKREITELGNSFDRTIREDTRYVEATLEQLEGLPQDWIDGHPSDENGLVRISTDYPDYFPVMKYAVDDSLRRALYITSQQIGSPENSETLKALMTKRHELATLLGYDSFAALEMDGLMIGNPENAQAFLARVGTAATVPAQRDMDVLLKRKRKIDPESRRVQAWQSSYLANLVRQEDYALDAQEVREYFTFSKVQDGIFQLTEDLFGVEIVHWDTPVWHESVSAWEMRRDGEAIGRFYMDLHPRDDKYKHAAHWTLRTGVKGVQLPLSGLATNFPRGLMEHTQVETFLHEFGHLLHNMFSGTQPWLNVSGMRMERDFVEAPSQMLEEWVWDYDSLARFASDNEGKVIPRDLVEKMNRARNFGTAIGTTEQIFYANISLNFYNGDPADIDLLPTLKTLQAKYSSFPYVEGTYFYNHFGHLNGYSSNYYMYQWSLAIATDLFTRFESNGMRNREVSHAYRDQVLGAAGSKSANDFVADFLGRPFSPQSYIDFLNGLNKDG